MATKKLIKKLSSPTIAPIKAETLKDKGYYYFHGRVEESSCASAITWILESNFAAKSGIDHLTLMITSSGGEIGASFALIDVMRGSKIPIHTVGLGSISSAALMMFIAGEKGNRIVTPNTAILSHQWAWGSSGKEHELFATIKEFDLTSERVINHYKKCTGLKEKVIREKLLPAHDVWLSAEQALKYGLCDKVKDMK